MTRDTYIRLTKPLRENEKKARLLAYINKGLTAFVFLLYPLFLLSLLEAGHPLLWRAILIPAISFAAVSIFRRIVNVPRPYEKFGLPPVLEKDTHGKSFPSRHVFSILPVYPYLGITLLVLGLILAIIRVIGGVHEPRDVIAGALIGIACGMLYYL